MQIEGVSALVTGGASGLGAATARLLAARGAQVAILDIDERRGNELAKSLGGVFAGTDVTDDDSIRNALDTAESSHGTARILVNCAGVTPIAMLVGDELAPHPLSELRRAIDINLTGTFMMLAHFASRLAQADKIGEERGVAVNTASIAAFDGSVGLAAYAASKGGVAALTLPAARELAARAIRVVAIAPGMFETPMVGHLPRQTLADLGASVPFPNRLGKPEEFASFVTSVITNPMLNGSVVRLDGAHRMPMAILPRAQI